jgi:hypothetical protein
MLEPVPALPSLDDSHATTAFYSVHESGLNETVTVVGDLSVAHPETHAVMAARPTRPH